MNTKTFSLTLLMSLAGCKSAGDASESKEIPVTELPVCMADAEEAVVAKATKVNETAEIIDSLLLYGDKRTLSDVYMISISDDTEPSDYVVVAEHSANGCSIKYAEIIASGILPQAEEATDACSKVVQEHVIKTLGATIAETKVLYGDKNSYGNAFLIRGSNKSDHAVITKSKGGSCEVLHAAQVSKS